MVEVTYSELKSLRDNKQLTPGCWYRITDYETTTSQNNTQSAGHLFDVIVLALDNKTLSEEAFACHSERDAALQGINMVAIFGSQTQVQNLVRKPHLDGEYEGKIYYAFAPADTDQMAFYTKSLEEEPTPTTIFVFFSRGTPTIIQGDPTNVGSLSDFVSLAGGSVEIVDVLYGYFAFSKLKAWKLWYCLDNDTSRFAWAGHEYGEDEHITLEDGRFPNGNRDPSNDDNGLYSWIFYDRTSYYLFTFDAKPKIGDLVLSKYAETGDTAIDIKDVGNNTISLELWNGREYETNTYYRNTALDRNGYYCWSNDEIESHIEVQQIFYTKTKTPSIGDYVCLSSNFNKVISKVSWQDNCKGVIYRMIDEWNNDLPYDFKNI